MPRITNKLDFASGEHVWEVRVGFQDYDQMDDKHRVAFQYLMRALAAVLETRIEVAD